MCVFCYSHNTKPSSMLHREISLDCFMEYLNRNVINATDHVILNGGEPTLHPQINEILEALKIIGCEIVIFSNGRLLSRINNSNLNDKFRFVVPIHGFEYIHDEVTRVKGSYRETINSLEQLISNSSSCLVDMKIIINKWILQSDKTFNKALETFEKVPYNNAVHITSMASTIVSRKHNLDTIKKSTSAYYTNLLVEHFVAKGIDVKIFDTCIKDIKFSSKSNPQKYTHFITAKAKDSRKEEDIVLSRRTCHYSDNCDNADLCISSVSEYKVLEISKGRVFETLE